MSSLFRFVASLRLPMLFFSLPYALLWARATDSGSWVMIVAHAALLLLYCLTFDRIVLDEGEDPRLALSRDAESRSRDLVNHAATFFGAVAIVATLLLFAMNWRLAILSSAALILILTTTRGVRGVRSRRRFVGAAIVWPAVLLIGPALFIGVQGWDETPAPDETTAIAAPVSILNVALQPDAVESEDAEPEASAPAGTPAQASVGDGQPMSRAVFLGSVLGGLMLGGYIMLCLVRDETADRSLGLRTLATTLGRRLTFAVIVGGLFVAVGFAAWGASLGDWHWFVAPTIAWTAVVVVLLLAYRMDDHAVGAWWIGHAVMACLLLATAA